MSLGLPQRVTHVGPNPRVYPPFRHANISGPQDADDPSFAGCLRRAAERFALTFHGVWVNKKS